ncbi:MAG: hypothetical protein OXP28_11340 [Gammaproteobacteria bacterium]|nr:hypothetical protein [Gammaproteobacteria bacterium]
MRKARLYWMMIALIAVGCTVQPTLPGPEATAAELRVGLSRFESAESLLFESVDRVEFLLSDEPWAKAYLKARVAVTGLRAGADVAESQVVATLAQRAARDIDALVTILAEGEAMDALVREGRFTEGQYGRLALLLSLASSYFKGNRGVITLRSE